MKRTKKVKTTKSRNSKPEQITKDMMIGDVIDKYPGLAEVFLEEGIHCVGCGVAGFETIEQGLMGHGKTKQEISKFIVSLNKSLPKLKGNGKTLFITDIAAKKLKEVLKEEKGASLRITILEDTEMGTKYEFAAEDKISKTDVCFELEKIKFAIDKKSFAKLKGSRIDYVNNMFGEGFKISK